MLWIVSELAAARFRTRKVNSRSRLSTRFDREVAAESDRVAGHLDPRCPLNRQEDPRRSRVSAKARRPRASPFASHKESRSEFDSTDFRNRIPAAGNFLQSGGDGFPKSSGSNRRSFFVRWFAKLHMLRKKRPFRAGIRGSADIEPAYVGNGLGVAAADDVGFGNCHQHRMADWAGFWR